MVNLIILLTQIVRPALALFLWVLAKLGIKGLKSRFVFEALNLQGGMFGSFSLAGEAADWSLEISSEGEWEQVRPWVFHGLHQGQKFEILYASPSVERQMLALAREFPQKVRVLRLPLLSHGLPSLLGGQNISNWLTSNQLVLVRYDFFPELIAWGNKEGRKLYLVSATLKGKEHAGPFKKALLPYARFYKILPVTEVDRMRFWNWGIPMDRLKVYDFRHGAIAERLEKRHQTLGQISNLSSLVDLIETAPEERRLLLAQAWPADLHGIFSPLDNPKGLMLASNLIWLAPHSFKKDVLDELERVIHQYLPKMKIFYVDEHKTVADIEKIKSALEGEGVIVISLLKGVLLEFYPFFSKAFVGGGYGRSVHSLLEPYWAGLDIYCGPRINRSTEWDFIKEESPNYLTMTTNSDVVKEMFYHRKSMDQERHKREQLLKGIRQEMPAAIEFLEGRNHVR